MVADRLEVRVAGALRRRGWTIAIAESCTGGGLAARITDIAGASDVFLGGIVAYHNEVKRSLLGVAEIVLAQHGAVSSEVAGAMAEACRTGLGATLGVGITGIAGPGGGTPEKPVGLVYIAVASPQGLRSEEFMLPGDRAAVRRAAVDNALQMVLSVVEEGWEDG